MSDRSLAEPQAVCAAAPGRDVTPPLRAPFPLAALSGWVVLALAFIEALNGANGWPDWQRDAAALRSLGLIPTGLEGCVSTLLAQLAERLPVGAHLLRADCVSAVAAAISARLVYALVLRSLERASPFAANPVLAAVASLLCALGPRAGAENVWGGAAVATALVWLALYAASHPRARDDARVWALAGVALGLAGAEDSAAGALAALLVALAFRRRAAPSVRAAVVLVPALLAFGASALVVLVPALGLGRWLALSELGSSALAPPTTPTLTLPMSLGTASPWAEGLLLLGVVVALLLPRARARSAPLLLVLGVGVLAELVAAAFGARAPSSLVWSSSLAAAGPAALALSLAARGAWRARVPLAKPACALLVSFSLTLLVQRLDAAAKRPRSGPSGAEAWTTRALERLPPGALVLLQSERLWRRWLAARVAYDVRPDVVVVPAAWLAAGAAPPGALALPAIAGGLARKLMIEGHADERSLSRVADERPVFVELDPLWDERLLEHLAPGPLWLSFAPHAVHRAERRAGVAESLAALELTLRAGEASGRDERTRRVLSDIVTQQALALAAVGDRAGAAKLLRAERALGVRDARARSLARRLRREERGRVALRELLE